MWQETNKPCGLGEESTALSAAHSASSSRRRVRRHTQVVVVGRSKAEEGQAKATHAA
jgi:hypothetical protein